MTNNLHKNISKYSHKCINCSSGELLRVGWNYTQGKISSVIWHCKKGRLCIKYLTKNPLNTTSIMSCFYNAKAIIPQLNRPSNCFESFWSLFPFGHVSSFRATNQSSIEIQDFHMRVPKKTWCLVTNCSYQLKLVVDWIFAMNV